VPAYSRPDRRWRLLVPPGAVVIMAAGSAWPTIKRVRALPAHTDVVLVGGRQLRALALLAGLHIAAEYIALPSLGHPVAIIQRKRQALRFAARHVITVPPGITRLHLAVWYAVRLVRAVPRLLAWLPAGDRMLVGTRS